MDIPTKLVKEFCCLFSNFIASNVNKCINEGTYVDTFKKAKIQPIYKRDGRTKKSNVGPVLSFPMFQKIMKGACMITFILILIKYFQVLVRFS